MFCAKIKSGAMLKKIVGKIWRKMSPSTRRRIIRLTQSNFTASVAVVVENGKGEVLLLDHVLRPASGWGIPGGFLASGEQPVDAVRRELREETGIELTDVEIFQVRTINRHIEVLFHARTTDAPEVKSREINRFGWFRPGDLPEKMNSSQKTIIRKLLKQADSDSNRSVV